MVTLFHRLTAYYQANPTVKPLTHKEKSTLGSRIAKAWYSQTNRNQFKFFLERTKMQEDDGEFTVLSYPDCFIEDIDKLIGDFYAVLNKPRRKRIPIAAYKSNRRKDA